MAKTLTRASTRRQTLFVCVFLVVVVFFVTTFRLAVVHGHSMEPTFDNGQIVLVRRRTWGAMPLKRGDVVLVQKGGDVLIKRIYRLPGETLDNRDVVIRTLANGVGDLYLKQNQYPLSPLPRLTVPPHEITVLGDNAQVSDDSRAFGPVPISSVLGVVVNAPPPIRQPYVVSMQRIHPGWK